MKKVTMQQVADRLNLSKNTISQALSGKAGVNDNTRRLIQETADELGYKYKRKVDDLNDTGSNTIVLLASEFAFSQAFFGEIFLSIYKGIKDNRQNLITECITSELIDNRTLPVSLEDKNVDGILILSHISTDYISMVIETGIPTVIIDHHDPSINVDAVLSNNRFGAYEAVDHLIKFGHKDIVFIGRTGFSPSYQERLEGYLLALHRNGIPVNSALIFEDIEESSSYIRKLLANMNITPTAYFCVNDELGFLVSSELQKAGIRIPYDVSVCSFDNGQLSKMVSPKLTSVNINLNYFGKKALEHLYWRIQNPDAPIQEILLHTELVIRKSTSEVTNNKNK